MISREMAGKYGMVIAKRVLPEWSLEGAQIELIQVWENVIFRISKDFQTYALRIHRSSYHTSEELNSELVWVTALKEYGLNVAEPLLTRDGRYIITESLPGSDETRYISLLKWVKGDDFLRMLDSKVVNVMKSKNFHYFEKLGNIQAQIHNQSSAWDVPKGFTRHSFDVEGLVGDSPKWGAFWALPQLQPKQSDLFEKVREIIGETLSGYKKTAETYSLIHGDLNMGNMIMDGTGYPPRDVMHNNECFRFHVIDFDDAGFGWHQHDFAVSLYHFRYHPKFEEVIDAFCKGYRKYRVVNSEFISSLPIFLLVKTLMNLSWYHQRPDLIPRDQMPKKIKNTYEEVKRFLDA